MKIRMTAPKIKEGVTANMRNESVETHDIQMLINMMDNTDLVVDCTDDKAKRAIGDARYNDFDNWEICFWSPGR